MTYAGRAADAAVNDVGRDGGKVKDQAPMKGGVAHGEDTAEEMLCKPSRYPEHLDWY